MRTDFANTEKQKKIKAHLCNKFNRHIEVKTMCLFFYQVFIFGHHCIKTGHLLQCVHGTNFHNYL